MDIKIISHRGGQTDYRNNSPLTPENTASLSPPTTTPSDRPAENTLEAIKYTLENENADGVEIDVIRTKDDKLAVIHSANLAEHVFNIKEKDKTKRVTDCTISELKNNFRVGPRHDGIIAELSEIMDFIRIYEQKHNKNIILNIEIKDVKGTDIPKSEETNANDILINYINNSSLTSRNIIISSFSISDIKYMEKLKLGVKLAFLYKPQNIAGEPIYINDSKEKYLPFTASNIENIHEEIQSLDFLHPPISDVNSHNIGAAKRLGLAINTWAVNEEPPTDDEKYSNNLMQLADKYDISVYTITNFVPQMRQKANKFKKGNK